MQKKARLYILSTTALLAIGKKRRPNSAHLQDAVHTAN